MHKSSSHPKLTELTTHQASPTNSASAFVKPALARPRSHENLSSATRALSHFTPSLEGNVTPTADIVYAVMNKGLAASECLVNIEEIKSAPALVDTNEEVSSQLATCIATQVMPDQGNGEIVASKAAELKDASSKEVEERYMRETRRATRVSVRVGVWTSARTSARAGDLPQISRKRSRGDLTVEEREILEDLADVGKVIEEQAVKNRLEV